MKINVNSEFDIKMILKKNKIKYIELVKKIFIKIGVDCFNKRVFLNSTE